MPEGCRKVAGKNPASSRTKRSKEKLREVPSNDGPPSEVDRIIATVNAHRTAAGLTPLRGGDRVGRSYIRARIRDYDFETVERVAEYAPEDSWIRDGARPKLDLHAIFSPKSFPMLLDRLDDGQGGGEIWGT